MTPLIIQPPLLTIGIPTYNRPDKLAIILQNLQRASVFEYSWVQVLIQDNSDPDCLALNQRTCELYECTHQANEENLGFAGNLIRIVQNAKGSFLWFLSDDDELHIENISVLLQDLPRRKSNDLVILPFTCDGGSEVANDEQSWKGAATLPDLFAESMPFILFSSFISPVGLSSGSKESFVNALMAFKGNDYLQALIPVMLQEICKTPLSIAYFPLPIINYCHVRVYRFALSSLHSSLAGLNSLLEDKGYFCTDLRATRAKLLLRAHLLMALQHKSGLKVIKACDDEMNAFAFQGLLSLDLKNILLAVAILLCPPQLSKVLLSSRGHTNVV